MGKRLAPILAIIALLIPVMAQALGLGDIVMKSALNQPLDAEIELVSVQSGDEEGLKVGLASAEDFARVGAERSYFLTKIKFNVEKKADGTPYIRLSTREPVTEPFLDFVVEARWPRGRLLREFTVLVDPPVLGEEKPALIQQATAQPAPAAAPAPARQAPIAKRATLTPVVSREGGLSYGPVRPNDTLWEIANQLRSDDSVTVNQMMLALVRDNPQAFYNGNVNQLKAGYVLRIKDPASLSAISVAEADIEIERQRAEWLARRSGRPLKQAVAAAAGGGAAGATGGGPAAAAPQASLKLVAPGAEGSGSGAGEAEVEQLRQDLVLAAEALDATRQETEELKTRLAEMEKQMQAMQRLITLKDDEMLALQQQMGGEEPAAEKPAIEEPAMGAEEATTAAAEAPAGEAPAGEAPAEATEPAPAPAPMPAAPPAAKAPTVEPGLFENPLLIYGGLGAVVLAIIGLVVMRRRKMQEGFQESILNVGEGGAPDSTAAAATAAAAGGESSMVSDFAMSEISDMSGIQTDNAEVDPVAEADVYLAYGRHQQAEEIIRDAMEKAPERNDLKLKMLEIFFATKDADNFDKQAQELHDALGNEKDPLWAKAVTMGSQLCPGNPLFGGVSAEHLQEELASANTESDEDLLDFDFDLDSSALDDNEQAPVAESDEIDLDAELEKMGTAVDVAEVVAENEPPQEDNSLDFDVSSLDFNLKADEGETPVAEAADEGLDFDLQSLDDSLHGEETTEKADEGLDFDFETADKTPTDEIEFDLDETPLALDETGAEPTAELSLQESVAETAESETAPTENELSVESLAEEEAVEFDMQDLGADQGLEAAGVAEAAVAETEVTADDLEMPDLSLAESTLEEGVDQELTAAGATAEAESEEGLLDEDIFAEVDEIGTKLDLARAYVDMGDNDGARSILDEVLDEGDADQQQQAKELLEKLA